MGDGKRKQKRKPATTAKRDPLQLHDVHEPPKKQPDGFVLSATDPGTPDVIDAWALWAERAGVDRLKYTSARQHARNVRAWQAANGSKVKLPASG